MIKILHSADWHLDSPLQLRNPEQSRFLRQAMAQIPGQITAICKAQGCDMMLLSGDLFDGAYATDTFQILKKALADAAVPVFIAPGNHDYVGNTSPWLQETLPENVHVFTRPVMESVVVSHLNCRVYGAGFTSMDCPALLADFAPAGDEAYQIAVLHGDPTQTSSPYCPITSEQVRKSGLDYLALGHIHKGDSFWEGKTLCAWPGCPMGRGYDEVGDKGVLVVTIDQTASAEFIPLDTPRFYDLEVSATADVSAVLPPVGNEHFYRITLTGESELVDLDSLYAAFSRFPNLELRDHTIPPVDIWGSAGVDTLEGMYFKRLRELTETGDEATRRQAQLAARIARQILDGQEVVLP